MPYREEKAIKKCPEMSELYENQIKSLYYYYFFRSTLKWLSQAKSISDSMEAAWGLMVNMKEIIVELLDSDNDGIRTMTVKFMEMLVLTQTHR
jgi:hypothetical protein